MASFVLRKAVVEPKNSAASVKEKTKVAAATEMPNSAIAGAGGLRSLLYKAAPGTNSAGSGESLVPLDPILQRELENWRRQEGARLLTIQTNISSEAPRLRSFLLARSREERQFLARSALDSALAGGERVIAILGLATTDLAEHTPDFIRIAKTPWLPELAEESLTLERVIRVYAIRALQRHQASAPDAAIALVDMARNFSDPVLQQALLSSAPAALGFPVTTMLPTASAAPAAQRAAEVSTANDQADFSEAKEEN